MLFTYIKLNLFTGITNVYRQLAGSIARLITHIIINFKLSVRLPPIRRQLTSQSTMT